MLIEKIVNENYFSIFHFILIKNSVSKKSNSISIIFEQSISVFEFFDPTPLIMVQ